MCCAVCVIRLYFSALNIYQIGHLLKYGLKDRSRNVDFVGSVGSVGSVDFADSTDSTESTDSTDSADSADSTESADSTDSADSADSVGSSTIFLSSARAFSKAMWRSIKTNLMRAMDFWHCAYRIGLGQGDL
ncbi:hypothetical protein BC938DRAFT_473186 [Jimgerdemannia flammicorona]|uniref:Uncharacterized protein n=1 Tax=Jimgerdemannia flammicorona TaxID=994334 RepID=A0A433Q4V5_9FUNG|nr:hypothetical protein BC938DRAFT_473186 [Jimgerdemannia flammicorona]